ncbi:MAG: M16 family metallopeptidase [Fibrobacterota bacterium]
MKKIIFLLLFFAAPALTVSLNIPVVQRTLSNGLTLLMVPDSSLSVVSCRLYYFTGSYYEKAGTTGLSHLYEHMMFKGTRRLGTKNYKAEQKIMSSIDSIDTIIQHLRSEGKTVTSDTVRVLRRRIDSLLTEQRKYIVKDEIWSRYTNNGATGLNAWTSDDMTAYIVNLPANRLELFCNIEADRMENLVLREFYSERDVVMEERRMRYGNNPQNRYFLRLQAQFYSASPYRNPTIGWASDIRGYTRDKLRRHIARFYRPDNAMIVLAGAVDTSTAEEMVRRYFDSIPRPDIPIPTVQTREPAPIGETRFTVRDKASPRLDILYHTPGAPHDDIYALDLVENILSGKSGRLYERLVYEEELCAAAGASNRWGLKDGMFHIWAKPLPGTSMDTVENIILEEVEKLKASAPTEFELQKTQNQLKKQFTFKLQEPESLSDNLAYFQKYTTWKDLFSYLRQITAVDDPSAAVAAHLTAEHRTTGRLINSSSEDSKETSHEK